jgi:hypothetical protein
VGPRAGLDAVVKRKIPKQALGPIPSPMQYIPFVISQGIKRPECETVHLHIAPTETALTFLLGTGKR